MDVSKNT